MPPSMRWSSVIPSAQNCACNFSPKLPSSRTFSSTSRKNVTRKRRQMYAWLESQGAAFRDHIPGSTNYLGAYNKSGVLLRMSRSRQGAGEQPKTGQDRDLQEINNADGLENIETKSNTKEYSATEIPPETRFDRIPFPSHKDYVSEQVLSEEFRENIWYKVMKEGLTVREVSALTSVEMSRVGAVVRMKEIEKTWRRNGRPLAVPYAKAVMSMLPQTKWDPTPSWMRHTDTHHESINDVPVHQATMNQLFEPVPESRRFTREDAAKAFDENLLPIDKRIPHPQLIDRHKYWMEGLSEQEIQGRMEAREEEEIAKRQKVLDYRAAQEAAVKKVDKGRWEFRFREVNIDDVGADGRGPKGTGWRYGKPHMDRKKGQAKIPQRVE